MRTCNPIPRNGLTRVYQARPAGYPIGMPNRNAQSEIVVGVDGSASATAAVRWAAGDAKLRRVALRLVNVVAPVSDTNASPWVGVSARADRARFTMGKYNARQILDSAYTAAIDVLSSHPEFPIHTGILTGLPVPALADYSKHAAMLVVGCRGRRRFSRAYSARLVRDWFTMLPARWL